MTNDPLIDVPESSEACPQRKVCFGSLAGFYYQYLEEVRVKLDRRPFGEDFSKITEPKLF